MDRVVAQLLAELDGGTPVASQGAGGDPTTPPQVFIIGATNRHALRLQYLVTYGDIRVHLVASWTVHS